MKGFEFSIAPLVSAVRLWSIVKVCVAFIHTQKVVVVLLLQYVFVAREQGGQKYIGEMYLHGAFCDFRCTSRLDSQNLSISFHWLLIG